MDKINEFFQSMEYIERYSRELYQEINEMIDTYVDISEEEKDKLPKATRDKVTRLENIAFILMNIDDEDVIKGIEF